MKIQVFDPPMRCSTGVCGPWASPAIVRFAADLDWLERQGVGVKRYNLSQQAVAFAGSPLVKDALEKQSQDCLPLAVVAEALVCGGKYPGREELASWAGLESPPSIFTDAFRELVAIGAAIASNCRPCFQHLDNEARPLGVPKDDIRLAVDVAYSVEVNPARSILLLADKYLSGPRSRASPWCSGTESPAPGGRCRG